MRFTVSVCTVRTTALRTTLYPSVKALTVLLLALALPAVAAFPLLPRGRLAQEALLDLLPALLVVFVVDASFAAAVFSTNFALSEALTIHFEALSLFAGAASFFFLDGGGGGDGEFVVLLGGVDGELVF